MLKSAASNLLREGLPQRAERRQLLWNKLVAFVTGNENF